MKTLTEKEVIRIAEHIAIADHKFKVGTLNRFGNFKDAAGNKYYIRGTKTRGNNVRIYVRKDTKTAITIAWEQYFKI